jgi:hypothetical protein
LIEGFSDAAVEFARETGLPHDIDHAMIQEIREAIEDGRVEEAVRRVNELDPEVSAARALLSPVSPALERTMGTPEIRSYHAPRLAGSYEQGHAEIPRLTDLI